jgi:hypothetical protein
VNPCVDIEACLHATPFRSAYGGLRATLPRPSGGPTSPTTQRIHTRRRSAKRPRAGSPLVVSEVGDGSFKKSWT